MMIRNINNNVRNLIPIVELITPNSKRFMRYSSSKEFSNFQKQPLEEKNGKRFIQTIPITNKNDFYSSLNYNMENIKTKHNVDTTNALQGSKWNSHKIKKESTPVRRSRTSRFKKREDKDNETTVNSETAGMEASDATAAPTASTASTASAATPTAPTTAATAATASTSTPTSTTPAPKKKKRVLKPRKAIISLSPNAIQHLRGLMEKPQGKYIRIGVQNRGCSGLTYHLEYVNEAGKFDELVEQEGVKVFIDSKALFSIVGSEMDWLEDKLSSRFIFKNPNSKGTCGCGESFMV